MKIGFVGKGGSGKTTVCSLAARVAAFDGRRVTAIDADINQHLAAAIGLDGESIERAAKLDEDQAFIMNFLRGANPRIDPASFFKTTPPGRGSNLIGVGDRNPIEERFGVGIDGVTVMMCGIHRKNDLGVKCYHGKTNVVDMILNHTVDGREDLLMVDMTAGADAFSSTLFTRFDLLVLVVEPTLKSVGVLRQYDELGAGYDLPLVVFGNKISSDEDLEFIRAHARGRLIGHLADSRYVRAMERGVIKPVRQLEFDNITAIRGILARAFEQPKDWDKYLSQLLELHRRIGPAWGAGAPRDLLTQVDPEFRYPMAANWNVERTPGVGGTT